MVHFEVKGFGMIRLAHWGSLIIAGSHYELYSNIHLELDFTLGIEIEIEVELNEKDLAEINPTLQSAASPLVYNPDNHGWVSTTSGSIYSEQFNQAHKGIISPYFHSFRSSYNRCTNEPVVYQQSRGPKPCPN